MAQGSRGTLQGPAACRAAPHWLACWPRIAGRETLGSLPALSVEQILAWADAHHARTGRWPNHKSGPIAEAPDEKKGETLTLRFGVLVHDGNLDRPSAYQDFVQTR